MWRLVEKHSFTYLAGKRKKKYGTDADRHEQIALHSQTRGMHTSSAEYTTFITFEPINRKSGGKATRIAVFRKLRKEGEKKQKQESSPKHQWINLSKRKIKKVNYVQWRLNKGPQIFLDHKIIQSKAHQLNISFAFKLLALPSLPSPDPPDPTVSTQTPTHVKSNQRAILDTCSPS